MREMKFRAWDFTLKEMLYWDSDNNLICDIIMGDDKDNYHIMQFTGLKDKNGVEIYEGDIFKFRDYYNADESNHVFAVIEYVPHSGMYMAVNDKEESAYMAEQFKHEKVIGNVHENGELLER